MIKYYLIGEVHGTKECPQACLDILERENIKQLALEFGFHLQPELDEFLAGKRSVDDLSIFDNPRDTRASEAMRDLIQEAKDMGMKLFFVDDYTGSKDQEKIMADKLMGIEGRVAYYCGSAHAAKKTLKYDPDSKFYPLFENGVFNSCGSLLPPEQTVSYAIHAVNGGKIWAHEIVKIPPAFKLKTFKPKKLPVIIDANGKKYDFFYLVDKFTPSTNLYILKNQK